MQLKLLREHYTFRKRHGRRRWFPKQPFVSKEDYREKTGLDPDRSYLYKCTICNFYHTASYPDTRGKNVS